MDSLKIALAQINPLLGDIEGNIRRILWARDQALEADLLLAGELSLSGYPPEDLARKPAFLDACRKGIEKLAQVTAGSGPALLVGTPWYENGRVYNSLLLLDKGRIEAKRFKRELPNYGVFDEKRIFDSGPEQGILNFRAMKLGLMICEDLWFCETAARMHREGADLLLLPNGSPYERGKPQQRIEIAQARQQETGLPVLYVNQVGGQDELVFDGGSFVLERQGRLAIRMAPFQEAVLTTHWVKGNGNWHCKTEALAQDLPELEEIYRAMELGLSDYVKKNNFPGVLLGLSGGIDSALTAAVAVDALGADKVRTVMMPSPYTTAESMEDARACAAYLGTQFDIVPIEKGMKVFDGILAPLFAGYAADLTEENIQARIRGLLLMALSNKTGAMLLTTGNKSEMAVGYATLYGDMCGGYSVLKDVYKTDVFRLASWRNGMGQVMPERVITKAPSAELRANQKDQDSLPPYDILDAILEKLIEEERGIAEIAALGYEGQLVKKVWLMLDRAEYKRRQAPPGVKLTRRAFGRDRRYPIVNGFWKNL